jgi:hypothetical protein
MFIQDVFNFCCGSLNNFLNTETKMEHYLYMTMLQLYAFITPEAYGLKLLWTGVSV